MLHVQQKHAGGIGIVAAVNAGEYVVYIILRQHDLRDLLEVFRLVLPHPENLGGGESGKGDVCRQRGQLIFADLIV